MSTPPSKVQALAPTSFTLRTTTFFTPAAAVWRFGAGLLQPLLALKAIESQVETDVDDSCRMLGAFEIATGPVKRVGDA